MKKFLQFINENKSTSKFKIGDKVYYHGRLISLHGYYYVGHIFDLSDSPDRPRKDNRYLYKLYQDIIPANITLTNVSEESLSRTKEEGDRKSEDLLKKKEMLKLKMKDVDPFGEEDWENENVHNDVDPYDEENWEDDENMCPYCDGTGMEEWGDNCEDCGGSGKIDNSVSDDVDRYRDYCRDCGSFIPEQFLTAGLCEYCLNHHEEFNF